MFCWHTRAPRARARAPNKPPNPDSFGARARARRAPAHMRKGLSGAHKLSQNHGIYDVFAASEKTKIEDKDSEKTKTLYFTMFLACRVPKLAFRKVPKTSLFTVFCTPTEDKTTLCAMFSYSQYPKMKPKQWYLRCFCNSEKGVFGECRKTKSNIRIAKIQKRCILRCFFPFRCENFCFEKRPKHRN